MRKESAYIPIGTLTYQSVISHNTNSGYQYKTAYVGVKFYNVSDAEVTPTAATAQIEYKNTVNGKWVVVNAALDLTTANPFVTYTFPADEIKVTLSAVTAGTATKYKVIYVGYLE